MDETREYEWTDNPTVSGESDCDTDVLNECLMHLKYNNSGGDAFPMFSTIVVDHILTGEEAIGWALQGSLITNTYPDAVAHIKDEYKCYTNIKLQKNNTHCFAGIYIKYLGRNNCF